MDKKDQTASPTRRQYRDKSNFGGIEAQDILAESRAHGKAPVRRRRVDIGGLEAFPEPRQPVPEQAYPKPEMPHDNEQASAYIYGQGAPDGVLSEEFDPEEFNDHDEFGRRRKRRDWEGSNAERVKMEKTKKRSRGREALSWILSIALAISAALLIRAFVFEIILVDGESMYPTLYTNERVAIEKVTRYSRMPERGEIIIVEYPNMDGTFVKRAIGLPGETVEVRDSTVYIDGEPLYEDYINPEPYADMEPVVVPENHVLVMGDNRAHSLDSRTSYIGPIARDAIVGHGLFVIWPFDSIHKID